MNMENKQWYAVYTKSRSEKQVAKELEELGIEHFLPLIKTMRQWSDRRKFIYVPLFSSYIFVKIDIKYRLKVLEVDGAVTFIHFNNEYPSIPEWQLNNLKIILGSAEKFEISFDDFEIGEKVKVDGGPFKGLQGTLVEYRGKKKFLVQVETINQNLLLEVNPVYVCKQWTINSEQIAVSIDQ